jgi:hypothetical protein
MKGQTLTEQVAELAHRIETSIPGTSVEVNVFPSGGAMLDVRRDGHLYVLAYLPSTRRFGVDEVLDGEGFEMGYRFGFDDFEPAAERLLELVSGAPAP